MIRLPVSASAACLLVAVLAMPQGVRADGPEPPAAAAAGTQPQPLPPGCLYRLGQAQPPARGVEQAAHVDEQAALNRKGRIDGMSLSPDGTVLAAIDSAGWVSLWDAATGKPLRRWRAHEVPDGKSYPADPQTAVLMIGQDRLVTSMGDGLTTLWNAQDGKALGTLGKAGHRERPLLALFGTAVVSVAAQGGVAELDFEKPAQNWPPRISYTTDGVHSCPFATELLACTVESRRAEVRSELLAGGWTRVHRHRLIPGQPMPEDEPVGFKTGAVAMAPSACWRWVLVSDRKGVLHRAAITDATILATGAPVERPRPHRILVGPGFDLVAVGCGDGSIELLDPLTCAALRRLPGHQGAVTSLTFSRDGRRLYTGSADTTIAAWDLGFASWNEPALPRLDGDAAWRRALAEDGRAGWAAAAALASRPEAVWRLAAALAAETPRPVTEADLAGWIEQLSSRQFSARKEAFEHLRDAGTAARAAVARAAEARDVKPEVKLRLEQLLAIYGGPPPVSAAVREAERIAMLLRHSATEVDLELLRKLSACKGPRGEAALAQLRILGQKPAAAGSGEP